MPRFGLEIDLNLLLLLQVLVIVDDVAMLLKEHKALAFADAGHYDPEMVRATTTGEKR